MYVGEKRGAKSSAAVQGNSAVGLGAGPALYRQRVTGEHYHALVEEKKPKLDASLPSAPPLPQCKSIGCCASGALSVEEAINRPRLRERSPVRKVQNRYESGSSDL